MSGFKSNKYNLKINAKANGQQDGLKKTKTRHIRIRGLRFDIDYIQAASLMK